MPRITPHGRVTIPAALRKKYGLLPKTRVEFVPVDDGVALRPVLDATESSSVETHPFGVAAKSPRERQAP